MLFNAILCSVVRHSLLIDLINGYVYLHYEKEEEGYSVMYFIIISWGVRARAREQYAPLYAAG